MPITTNRAGTAGSIVRGMAIAAAISITTTILLSVLIASSLNHQKITWTEAGYWIMGMIYITAFTSGKSAYMIIKHQKMAVCLMSGFLYWGILLCTTALLFGGNFGPIWETAGIIIAGSITSILSHTSILKNNHQSRNRTIVKLNKKQCR